MVQGGSMLKVEHVYKSYRDGNKDLDVLADINIEVLENKGLIFILGASGSGKSTLLNIIAKKDKNYKGSVKTSGKVVYISQDVRLFEDMTVLDNLKIIDDRRDLPDLLKSLDLKDVENKKVFQLSNGQKKRLELIKAILLRPDILLLDEICSALDHDAADKVLNILSFLSTTMMIVIVSHDEAQAQRYATRIIKIENKTIAYDKEIKDVTKLRKNNRLRGKNLSEHFHLCFKKLRSKMASYIIFSLAMALGVTSIFFTYAINSEIRAASSYQNAFKYGRNIIDVSGDEPQFSEDVNGCYGDYGTGSNDCFKIELYDTYRLDDVESFITAHPEIIAFAPYWDQNKAKDDRFIIDHSDLLGSFANFYFHNPNEYGGVSTYMIEGSDYAYTFEVLNVFPISRFFIEPNEKLTYKLEPIPEIVYHDADINSIYKPYAINLNYLLKELPLLDGEVPKSDDEIIIDRNAASFLVDNKGYDTIEDLIGEELVLRIYRGHYTDSMIGRSSNIEKILDQFDHDYLYYYCPSFTFKISGIADVATDGLMNIFTTADYRDNDVFDTLTVQEKSTEYKEDYKDERYTSYIYNPDAKDDHEFLSSVQDPKYSIQDTDLGEIYFDDMTFILEPGTDIGSFTDALIEHFDIKYDKVTVLDDVISNDENLLYKDLSNFYPFIILLCILVTLIPLALTFFSKKKESKERELSKLYGYSIDLVYVIGTIILFLITSLFTLIAIYFLDLVTKGVITSIDLLVPSMLISALIIVLVFVSINMLIKRIVR